MTRLHRHLCALTCLLIGLLCAFSSGAVAQSQSWIQPYIELDEDPFTQVSTPASGLIYKPAIIRSSLNQRTPLLFTSPAPPSPPPAATPPVQASTPPSSPSVDSNVIATRIEPLPFNPPQPDLTPTAWKPQPPSYLTSVNGPQLPPPPKSFWQGWTGNIEGGLNGSSGLNDNLSVRAGLNASRETTTATTTAALSYTYDTSDGIKTKSRGVFDLRNDWNITDRWVLFAIGKAEYDEFQDWDWRLSLFTGPGYYFIKEEKTKFLGRVGAGLTKELGGSRTEFTPEGLLGFDLEHSLTQRQKIFLTSDFLPDLSEVGEYRINTKAGWEILVDPEVNLTLKLGVEDRYNTNPGPDSSKNDLEYFALLVFPF